MTQIALSERANVNLVTVAEIETDRNQGSVATLRALTGALSVGPDYLGHWHCHSDLHIAQRPLSISPSPTQPSACHQSPPFHPLYRAVGRCLAGAEVPLRRGAVLPKADGRTTRRQPVRRWMGV